MAARKTPRPRRDASPGREPIGRGIHRSLEREIRRRLAASPGGHLVNGKLGALDLRLAINLEDPASGEAVLVAAVEAALDRYVQETVAAAAAFRPGRVFCHRHESSDCPHAAPPASRDVFGGYTPTGLPRWIDFGQLCLDLRHPQVERLYGDRPVILTQLVSGAHLKADLLPEFHRSARLHDVAAQLCIGLFPLGGEGRALALTFQAVVTRRRRARRVGLNLIGGDQEAMRRLAPHRKPWRGGALWARSKLDELGRRDRRAPASDVAFEGQVGTILQGLARRIERDLRGRERRTRHAEERHEGGERPTRKAIDDLRDADDGSILLDSRHATLVVLGPRGRTHFFAPEGRLVSSVHYPKEAIDRRVRTGQWRAASAAEIGGLRDRVERSTETDADERAGAGRGREAP